MKTPAVASSQGWDGDAKQDAGHRKINNSNWVFVLCPWSNLSTPVPCSLLFPRNLCLILTRIRNEFQKQMSKSPPLLPRDDWSNSTISSMLEAGTLEKYIFLHHFHPLIFSPTSWGLNFGRIPYTLSVVTMQSSLIERLIWCLQLVYFLEINPECENKALNLRRYNSFFVINNSLPSNHLLSYCIKLHVNIWSAAIKDLLPCFSLPPFK